MKTRPFSLLLVMWTTIMPMKLLAADGNAEPYAVLSDNNTVLTFYYGNQKEARGGMSVVTQSTTKSGTTWRAGSCKDSLSRRVYISPKERKWL